jgi:hypothetical protein
VAAWRETYSGLVPERMLSAFSVAERIRRWHRILTAPDPSLESAVFVAVRPEQSVVGLGSCGRQPMAHQRQGIGRRLMALMAQDLLARELCGAALWVLRDNQPARRFYEMLGARLVSQRVETVDEFISGEGARAQDMLHEVAYGWPDLSILAPR